MSIEFQDPIECFDLYVPTSFLEDAVRCLAGCWSQAYSESRKLYPSEVAHDYRPVRRRADFERELAIIARKYSGMNATYYPNAAGNCWHLRVTCGNVILTQSYIDRRQRDIRRAEFRDTLARGSQLFLFPEMTPTDPQPDSPLYAILRYDGVPDQSALLWADVVFPDPQGEIVARIDLVHRFPRLFGAGIAVAEEVVVSDIDIDLHEDVKEKRKTV